MSAQLPNPAEDGLSATGDSRGANAAIFFEGAAGSYGADADAGSVFFEEQMVAGGDAEGAANLMRHGDLALAGDARLFFHGCFPHSLP